MSETNKPKSALGKAVSRAALAGDIKGVGQVGSDKLGVDTEDEVATDPVLANALNQETPVQSRLTWIGGGGILVAALYMGQEILTHGLDLSAYEWGDMEESVLVLVPAMLTLYARWYPKLKPLFWQRWWWPW